MAADRTEDESAARNAAQFATTHWSVVLAAGDSSSPDSQEALEKLCRQYWFPVYAFVRRKGYSVEDARDMTQEFFLQLLERQRLRHADHRRGRFRSFILASLNHFLVNEWDRAKAIKRGGKIQFISWDDADLDDCAAGALASDLTPEQVFDQHWAMALLGRVLGQLRDEMTAAGRTLQFENSKPFLIGDQERGSYGQRAQALGISEAALKMTVSRVRRRYGELLRQEMAQTVSTPAQLEQEWSELIAALRGVPI